MATPQQIMANRANAQLSTGPSSVEGKAASSRNALKFGIHAQSLVIPGEDPDELAALARDYEQDLRPIGPVEAAVVQTLVRSDWMLRRLARIEAEVIRTQLARSETPAEFPLAQAYIDDAAGARLLESLARRQRAVQRDYFQALKLIRELKTARSEAEMFRAMTCQPIDPSPLRTPPAENRLRSSNPAPSPRVPSGNPALRL